jgi:hypothetical protein
VICGRTFGIGAAFDRRAAREQSLRFRGTAVAGERAEQRVGFADAAVSRKPAFFAVLEIRATRGQRFTAVVDVAFVVGVIGDDRVGRGGATVDTSAASVPARRLVSGDRVVEQCQRVAVFQSTSIGGLIFRDRAVGDRRVPP